MSVLSIEANERVTFGVRYEDEHLVVVDKPAGVVTNPGVGHQHDTLLNGLFARYGDRLQNLGKARDFGLVHRLDRDTSGLVIIALTANAYDGLRAEFETRAVGKYYWAIVHKTPRETEGVIKRAIIEELKRKDKYTSEKFARIARAGKPAVTAYRTLEANELGALIEARPVTGRLHQVRVHLASVGAGLLGDMVYSPNRVAGAHTRVALHAHRLVFEHPVTEETLDVRSPMPKDLKKVLGRLGLGVPEK